MFHKATLLEFGEGTSLIVTFQDGAIKKYDMAALFEKYPKLALLKNREVFTSAKLLGYGITWNEDLDIETETIYEEGETIGRAKPAGYIQVGEVVLGARAEKNLSQKQLSKMTGIDQADLSRIERGVANPSVGTLMRIAAALDKTLSIEFTDKA